MLSPEVWTFAAEAECVLSFCGPQVSVGTSAVSSYVLPIWHLASPSGVHGHTSQGWLNPSVAVLAQIYTQAHFRASLHCSGSALGSRLLTWRASSLRVRCWSRRRCPWKRRQPCRTVTMSWVRSAARLVRSGTSQTQSWVQNRESWQILKKTDFSIV